MSVLSEELTGPAWQDVLRRSLPMFGHRNWIVIADAAYPAQCAAGITTVLADADQLDVVRQVLSAISAATHVKPTIYTDRELSYVSEPDAPGVTEYRAQLADLMQWSDGRTTHLDELHEAIIAKLDRAAATFDVLIVETRMAIPYTSVFLELDCAYWTAGAEARLRANMIR